MNKPVLLYSAIFTDSTMRRIAKERAYESEDGKWTATSMDNSITLDERTGSTVLDLMSVGLLSLWSSRNKIMLDTYSEIRSFIEKAMKHSQRQDTLFVHGKCLDTLRSTTIRSCIPSTSLSRLRLRARDSSAVTRARMASVVSLGKLNIVLN